MEVRFEDKKLEKLCMDEREMQKKRSDIAKRLRLRINALRTAETVGELAHHDPLGAWHPLSANLDGLWSGKLSANYRLLVQPDGSTQAREAVTVTVIEISNHYDH
ncbi:plasmid maintenance system killer protein [Arthrobacter sp. EpRS71]|nr:type II toxin-antitoxin system RelE/ParE family toxin [Arthrobacter sp. EpRS71]KUM36716.1 plasmid maintenance system killer protein [Arthrobacter sp. EpRS71]